MTLLQAFAGPCICAIPTLNVFSAADYRRHGSFGELFLHPLLTTNRSASNSAAFCFVGYKKSKNGQRRLQHPICGLGQVVSSSGQEVLSSTEVFSERAVAKLVAIVGNNASSRLRQATWEDVMQHMAQRLKWVNEGFEMTVINDRELKVEHLCDTCKVTVRAADIMIVVSVHEYESVKWILDHSSNVANVMCFDSSPDLKTRLGGRFLVPEGLLTRLRSALPGNSSSEDLKVLSLVEEAWKRNSSDDIRFALLILIDAYVSPVDCLKSLRATDLSTLKCMIKNCGPQILACLSDPNCRKALACLTSCASTDQVCSYQCIASYESPQLEAFSLCILQKHNCLGLTADIPSQPDVQPFQVFRGQPLNHDLAEDIFIGWLGKLQWSWRVAAGQNPAYDQFPCQFQIFYRGRAKGSMWYDPVFRVRTLDDRVVWRRRHYRVKRAVTPGTFFFSVLDNGVVSKEYWRIVDATDDLSWGLFFYSGAAAAAGQSYTGAVLVTPDGQWPAESENSRLNLALEKCGIKHWEMYTVNNAACDGPPLELPEDVGLKVTSLWG